MNQEYTTGEAADLLGVSVRQLQWWDEKRLVVPIMSKHRRIYREADMRRLRLVLALRGKGMSIQRIREVLLWNNAPPIDAAGWLLVGDSVEFVGSPALVADIISGWKKPAVVARLTIAA